jgi:outer membrane immunogenic protein
VTPYLSAGVGAARYSISAMPVLSGGVFTTESNDVMVFAYQFGAGVGYAVTPRFTIDLKYRYLATSNPRLGDTILHYGSHNLYLGARFTF